MKKLLFLALTIYFSCFPSALVQEHARAKFCQDQFDLNVTDVIKGLRATVPPQEVKLAQAYIYLVKQREILDAKMLLLERTTLIDPRIQGPLKRPYDNFADCIRLQLLFPRDIQVTRCENQYLNDVRDAIITFAQALKADIKISDIEKCRMVTAAEEYIREYRQRGEVNGKLLLFEQQTILNVKPLEGRLRKPYDIYDQCKDPHSLVPLNFEPPISKCTV